MKIVSLLLTALVSPAAFGQVTCGDPVSFPSSNGKYVAGQKFEVQIQCASDNAHTSLHYKWLAPLNLKDSPSVKFSLQKSAKISVEVSEDSGCPVGASCGAVQSRTLDLKIVTACHFNPDAGKGASMFTCPSNPQPVEMNGKATNTSPCPTDPNPPSKSCGQPVNIASGSMWHEQDEGAFSLPGRTPKTALSFRRIYTANSATAPGSLGPGWHHNYETSIITYVDQSTQLTDVIWIDESGGPYIFLGQTGGAFTAPPGLNISLTYQPSNGAPLGPVYALQKADKTTYYFSAGTGAEFGKILQIVDSHGEPINFAYDSQGRLSTVSNALNSITFFYNMMSQLIQVGAPYQTTTQYLTYTYQADGRLSTQTDWANRTYAYTYVTTQSNSPAQGMLETITDPLGRQIRFSYDSQGRALQQFEPGGGVWSFSYENLQTSVTQPNSFTTTYFFDNKLEEIKRVYPDGTVFNTAWNSNGYRSSEGYDLFGNTLYGYDANGNLSSIQRPLDPSPTTIAYDQNFNVPTLVTPLAGAPTGFTLNPNTGDVVGMTRQGSSSTLSETFTRDIFGGLLSTNNGLVTYSNQRNTNGLLTYLYDTYNPVGFIQYDSQSRLADMYVGNDVGQQRYLEYTYTQDGQLQNVIDEDSGSTPVWLVNTYDSVKRLVQQDLSFLNGGSSTTETTKYAYDARDRVSLVTNPLGQKTQFIYDPVQIRDEPISVIDTGGRATFFTYDSRDRLIQKTDPNGAVTYYTYDGKGRLTNVADANGNNTVFIYDANDRLISQIRPSAMGTSNGNAAASATINYFYDLAGRLLREEHVSASGGSTRAVVYTYDSFDRVVSKTIQRQGATNVVDDTATYTYSPQLDANLLTSANNNVANETFGFDSAPPFANRTFSMSAAQSGNPLGLIQGSYSAYYDNTGQVGIIFSPSGAVLFEYLHDPRGNLIGVRGVANANATALNIGRDGIGRKTSIGFVNGPTGSYQYDPLNRTTSVSWTGGAAPISESLTYNAAGDPTVIQRESGTYNLGFDAIDQLTSATGLYQRALTYDLLGNRIQDSVNGPGSFISNFQSGNSVASYSADPDGFGDVVKEVSGGVTKNYGFRSDDRFTSYSDGSNQVSYYYDGLGRRVAKNYAANGSAAAFTQSYQYLGLSSQLIQAQAGNGTITGYVDDHTQVDSHLFEFKSDGTVTPYYTDHLGSVLNSAPAGGTSRFGLFGEVPASVPVAAANSPVMYGFAGREFEPESGLYYNRARMYSSIAGRFLSQDPIGHLSGDDNFYRAMVNNPLRFTDPGGLACDSMDIELQQAQTINDALGNEGPATVENLINGYAIAPVLPALVVGTVAGGAEAIPAAYVASQAAVTANINACVANPGLCIVSASTNFSAGYANGSSGSDARLPVAFTAPINQTAATLMGGGGAVGPAAYGAGFTVGKSVNYFRNR